MTCRSVVTLVVLVIALSGFPASIGHASSPSNLSCDSLGPEKSTKISCLVLSEWLTTAYHSIGAEMGWPDSVSYLRQSLVAGTEGLSPDGPVSCRLGEECDLAAVAMAALSVDSVSTDEGCLPGKDQLCMRESRFISLMSDLAATVGVVSADLNETDGAGFSCEETEEEVRILLDSPWDAVPAQIAATPGLFRACDVVEAVRQSIGPQSIATLVETWAEVVLDVAAYLFFLPEPLVQGVSTPSISSVGTAALPDQGGGQAEIFHGCVPTFEFDGRIDINKKFADANIDVYAFYKADNLRIPAEPRDDTCPPASAVVDISSELTVRTNLAVEAIDSDEERLDSDSTGRQTLTEYNAINTDLEAHLSTWGDVDVEVDLFSFPPSIALDYDHFLFGEYYIYSTANYSINSPYKEVDSNASLWGGTHYEGCRRSGYVNNYTVCDPDIQRTFLRE
jgi:hypothetical protein